MYRSIESERERERDQTDIDKLYNDKGIWKGIAGMLTGAVSPPFAFRPLFSLYVFTYFPPLRLFLKFKTKRKARSRLTTSQQSERRCSWHQPETKREKIKISSTEYDPSSSSSPALTHSHALSLFFSSLIFRLYTALCTKDRCLSSPPTSAFLFG